MSKVLARWETRGKARWVEIHEHPMGFDIKYENGSGWLPAPKYNLEKAIENCEYRVKLAKEIDGHNMKRVV